jgi:hypothetical protein
MNAVWAVGWYKTLHVWGCWAMLLLLISRPLQIAEVGGGLWDCGALPEAIHPQSFRSSFGHNTNVWASKGKLLAPKGPPATLLAPELDLKKWV